MRVMFDHARCCLFRSLIPSHSQRTLHSYVRPHIHCFYLSNAIQTIDNEMANLVIIMCNRHMGRSRTARTDAYFALYTDQISLKIIEPANINGTPREVRLLLWSPICSRDTTCSNLSFTRATWLPQFRAKFFYI